MSFTSAASYTLARFTNYPNAPCPSAVVAPGCAINPVTGTTGFSRNGFRVNSTPDWAGTMALSYTRDVNDWLNVHSTVGADFQSHVWNDGGDFNPAFGRQSSFTKVNLSAGIGAPDGSWELNVIGTNLFDVLTTSGKYNFITVNVFTIEEGRRIMLQGKLKL